MRLLHTGDWHLGKRLHGVDRRDEARAALARLAEIARDEAVDAVVVAGDLLDRRVVDAAPLGDCLAALEDLASVAPVLAVAGNHDDPDLWTALAPYLALRGIHAAGRVRAADEAVLTVETSAGPLHAALLPWPEPARLRTLPGTSAQAAKATYADLVASLLASYATELRGRREREGGAAVLVAHLMADGALAGGGEREMTMGITYAVPPAALPTDLDYVALGHVHRPQQVPRTAAPARYAGSPMALDFSEDNHAKAACIVEIRDGTTTVRELPLDSARPLARIRGTLDELPARAAEHPRAWFLCEVALEGPVLDLVRQVRELVPDALRVEPRYPDAVPAPAGHAGDEGGAGAVRALPDLYADWYALQGRPLPAALRAAFAAALEAAAHGEGADGDGP